MSNISGSALDIITLINQAEIKILEGEESSGREHTFQILVDKLNSPEYQKKSDYELKPGTIQRSILFHAHKLVSENKGHLGLTFYEGYLNRLSQFVYQKTFEQQFGKFNGILYDIKRGIEKIPQQISSFDNNAFLKDLRELGITGTVNKLSSSRFEPKQCMESTKQTLFFMGILGSKWVEEMEEFRTFLKKIQSKPNGKVKFLMINPYGDGFKLLKTLRGENLKDNSTHLFKKLVDEFDCLEARFYDFLPCFRLLFIDNKILAMSRYNLDEVNYRKNKNGWEAPHLVIEPDLGNWSLFEPFLFYYEIIWKNSKDIRQLAPSKKRNHAN